MPPIPPVYVYTWAQEDADLSKRSQLKDRIFKTAIIILITIPLLLLLASTGHARALKASYYSKASLIREGTRKPGEPQIQANGEPFNENAMTCASRDYPLGSILRITNKANGKTVHAKVTDRIGRRFKGKRIDLAKGVFIKLSPLSKGVIFVDIKRIV